jgi:hypothetical protein
LRVVWDLKRRGRVKARAKYEQVPAGTSEGKKRLGEKAVSATTSKRVGTDAFIYQILGQMDFLAGKRCSLIPGRQALLWSNVLGSYSCGTEAFFI